MPLNRFSRVKSMKIQVFLLIGILAVLLISGCASITTPPAHGDDGNGAETIRIASWNVENWGGNQVLGPRKDA